MKNKPPMITRTTVLANPSAARGRPERSARWPSTGANNATITAATNRPVPSEVLVSSLPPNTGLVR